MKKFKEFLLSLVVPHRMVRFKDMSVFISILLLLLGLVISVFSSNFRMEKYVKDDMVYSDYTKITEDKKLDQLDITIKDGQLVTSNSAGIYKETLKDDKTNYEVTVVIGECEIIDNAYLNVKNFSVDEYVLYNQANRKQNTIYLLYVFANASVYHLYDLGQVKDSNGNYVNNYSLASYLSVSTPNPNASFFDKMLTGGNMATLAYYVPKDYTELSKGYLSSSTTDLEGNSNYAVDNWSSLATKDEGVYEKDIDGQMVMVKDIVLENGQTITVKAMPKLGSVINNTASTYFSNKIKVFANYSNLESYGNFAKNGFKYDTIKTSIKDFAIGFFETQVYTYTDFNKLVLLVIALLMFVIIPTIFSLFVWLFTRKRGMTSFKNYFNIMSIIQFYVAIIFFIVGWFTNLVNPNMFIIIIAGILLMLWYFIFVIYQITRRIEKENEENQENFDNIRKEEEKKVPTKPEFKKIDDDVSVIG